jgi:hypothetical protein
VSEPRALRNPSPGSEPHTKRKPDLRSEPVIVRKPQQATTREKTKSQERAIADKKTMTKERKEDKMDTLSMLVDATLAIEKVRVRTQVRQSHLRRQHRRDRETDELLSRIRTLEDYVDGRIADILKSHPAYHWFSRVKGVGKENIAKVVGMIDIQKGDTISSLWKFAGFSVEDGKAPKRTKGEKLSYNSQLRSMCWRLGGSLKKAKGKFYQYYIQEKDKYTERFRRDGYKILPTPQGKWVCSNCGESWTKKRDIVPCCEYPSVEKKLREEPPGVIWLGHLDAMALRKMIKLFLACLWLIWREAEGLPLTRPYAIDQLGHNSFIDPWEMTDK